MLTLVIGGVGLVSAYVSYTPEIAARYLLIFMHLLIYLFEVFPIVSFTYYMKYDAIDNYNSAK